MSADNHGLALLQSMALVSTLSAVAEVWTTRTDRLAGHDPSEQESPGIACAELSQDLEDVDQHLLHLRAALLFIADTEASSGENPLPLEGSVLTVRRFDALLVVNRLATRLHRIHQRLLSLYPAVPELLIEEARRLQATYHAALSEETLLDELLSVVERTSKLNRAIVGLL